MSGRRTALQRCEAALAAIQWVSIFTACVALVVLIVTFGWLVFGRPDIKGVEMLEDFAIKPIAGNVVFFPSYMWHGTNPIYSDTQRLTVAFDIVPES